VYVLKSSSKRQGKEEVVLQDIHENVCIGRMPIMVKSRFCHLHDLTDAVSASKGDCAFDIGGYFIIKGSEKVKGLVESLRVAYFLLCNPFKAGLVCKLSANSKEYHTVYYAMLSRQGWLIKG